MLPAVHEAPGPDFLHDLDSYGSYYSQESISRSHMFPIDTLGNITFLGLDIDRDVGGPPTFYKYKNQKLSIMSKDRSNNAMFPLKV